MRPKAAKSQLSLWKHFFSVACEYWVKKTLWCSSQGILYMCQSCKTCNVNDCPIESRSVQPNTGALFKIQKNTSETHLTCLKFGDKCVILLLDSLGVEVMPTCMPRYCLVHRWPPCPKSFLVHLGPCPKSLLFLLYCVSNFYNLLFSVIRYGLHFQTVYCSSITCVMFL